MSWGLFLYFQILIEGGVAVLKDSGMDWGGARRERFGAKQI